MRRLIPLLAALSLTTAVAVAQTPDPPLSAKSFANFSEGVDRTAEEAAKNADDILWRMKLGDVASIEKYEVTSLPGRDKNPTGQGAGNPLIIPVYVFAP